MVMIMWFAWVIWGKFFLAKILQKATQRPTKVHCFHINKLVTEMVIMNDVEWPRLSYYVIYYEKFKQVTQRTEKVALSYSGHKGISKEVWRGLTFNTWPCTCMKFLKHICIDLSTWACTYLHLLHFSCDM